MPYLCVTLLFLLVSTGMAAPESAPGPAPDSQRICNFFYDTLAPVPHLSINREQNQPLTDLDGKQYAGCRLIFNSHTDLLGNNYPLPSFQAEAGTELFQQGWRPDDRYLADGPGTSQHGISKNSIRCIIDWDQQAWLDDQTNKIMQSDLINLEIRCLDTNSRIPDNR